VRRHLPAARPSGSSGDDAFYPDRGAALERVTSGRGTRRLLSAKLVKNATLKIYKGAPHGMCTTLKNQINEELLSFFKA
jgi:hypothetical protein